MVMPDEIRELEASLFCDGCGCPLIDHYTVESHQTADRRYEVLLACKCPKDHRENAVPWGDPGNLSGKGIDPDSFVEAMRELGYRAGYLKGYKVVYDDSCAKGYQRAFKGTAIGRIRGALERP